MLTIEQQKFLAISSEFQRLLNEDPYLDALAHSRYDHSADVAATLETIGVPMRIGALTMCPLTPALWAFLWAIGNNYAMSVKNITEDDTDVFLYLLFRGKAEFQEMDTLSVRAEQWCPKHGIEYPDAAAFALDVVQRAFFPLSMLPNTGRGDSEVCFDTDWLVQICCEAVRESGHPLEYVMHKMSLSLVLWCYVNRLRRNDDKGVIRKRTIQEVDQEIIAYVDELGERFCQEHCPSAESKKSDVSKDPGVGIMEPEQDAESHV